ncbi:GHKL domain-containing protein [Gemmiger formicilis]|uniref:GHKL domain-containing protein n=1 Tax=Gemmiger formicilis TaxID=745368 RepID=UPI003995AB7C
MMTLPDIPRLYTALAEVLAVLVYAQAAPPRAAKPVTYAATAGWAAVLGVFLRLTGSVPLAWWLPCMVAAIAWLYLYLWGTREMNLLEAGYSCARAFILAELAASVEWQLHCVLWPQQRATAPLSVLLLAAVYTTVYGFLYWFERRHAAPTRLTITAAATLMAVVMAVTAFAVSNLSFISDNGVTMSVMSIFYIRTLVDMAGVLILTVQHEQLREAALHSELTAMDNVLRRQYEQYRQSKENIRLINRRYHELKMQIAAIRAERDQAKQDAALAEMESGIRQYEAENKTGNPVLDTLLTAKTLYCQQHGINLTCVADGTLLHFLTTGEICTIVGTVLDNATESVLTEPDPEKRLIRAAIYAQNGFVMLRFENYCADPVELGPDGLPARSSHGGYDLKSARAAAEAHGGTLTLHWENEWFTVRILLPQK